MMKKGKTLTIVAKRQDDPTIRGSSCHPVETITVDDVKTYYYRDDVGYLTIKYRLIDDTFESISVKNDDVDCVEVAYQ